MPLGEKEYEVLIKDPNAMGRPFLDRWITVKARTRKEAKAEAAMVAGVNVVYVSKVKEIPCL